jgi:type I restriction-modification system DNA methylase subunit
MRFDKYSPVFQALTQLDLILRSNAVYTRRPEQLLSCIALARLKASDAFQVTFEELINQTGWEIEGLTGLPSGAGSVLTDIFKDWRQSSEALHILKMLVEGMHDVQASNWDVLPYLTTTDRRSGYPDSFFLAQPVVGLMLDMLHNETGSIWVPFDVSGQIAITALRRGYVVNTASINNRVDLVAQLLFCIETGGVPEKRLINAITRDATGRPTLSADFVIAAPPFGTNSRSDFWTQWESSSALDPYDRAEAWAVSELLPRAKKRLIVLTSNSWLFATGQEKRLRTDLLSGSRSHLESVTTLPPGVLSTSNIATAITSFDVRKQTSDIRLSNLAGDERGLDLSELIRDTRELVLGNAGGNQKSRLFNAQEIREAEYVLLPQRLLGRATFGGANAVPLGEICVAVRPTTPYRGTDSDSVLELGIPNLRARKWNPLGDIHDDEPKIVNVKPRERAEVFLREDDILLSVKGTLGLARLLSGIYGETEGNGEASQRKRAVVSTSCVALRLDHRANSKGITPVYLSMYLRSAEGQEQIKALQVGAAMPHISVQSLLSALRIPVPSSDELAAVHADFEKLCALEKTIEDIEQEMTSIEESRWLVKLA